MFPIQSITDALHLLLRPEVLIVFFAATIGGICVGAIPGLTATMTMAALIGFTLPLPTELAIVILIGIYTGAVFGGSIAAILVNIPGTPAAAATALDGYPLTLRGEGIKAIRTARMSSMLGELIGDSIGLLIIPGVVYIALKFGSFETFLLTFFAILICGFVTSPESFLKGWVAGLIGVFISFIGMDVIHGVPRFTFGLVQLWDGIGFLPALVGLFGISEIIIVLQQKTKIRKIEEKIEEKKNNYLDRTIKFVREHFYFIKKHIGLILRSGLIGIFLGSVPGIGESVSCWVSYQCARITSKKPELFGKGSYEGIVAAETANNATSGGTMIPTLTLGIPGDATSAVMLTALILHGLKPGPLMAVETPQYLYFVMIAFIFSAIVMYINALFLAPLFQKILTIKKEILMPIVFIFCVMGTFAWQCRVTDVWIMFAFGVLGVILRRLKYPLPPLILGLILGGRIDENLRRALIVLRRTGVSYFYDHPLGIVIIILMVTFGAYIAIKKPMRKLIAS